MRIPKTALAFVRGFGRFHQRLLGRFRRLDRLGPGILGRDILILTTRGRRTGREVSVPLLHVAAGDRLYVVASLGGNDEPPGWYRNLRAHPEVTVELRGERQLRWARTLAPEEAVAVWPRLLAIYPPYAKYQRRTKRLIPIVELAAPS